ncbi:MAG: gamma-glutamylcyclotransferase [Planctomycetota bacterium]|nr:gamma-glutamylcyclotransferase [Planctomycetota bacterium]
MSIMSLYFAYGSNLNTADRRRWCRSKETEDFVKRAVEVAYLPDHELVFHYRSLSRGGGALDIRARTGQIVPGMLFELRDGGLHWLDKKEGGGTAYRRKKVVVLMADGREREALSYEVVPERREDAFVSPADGYAELVHSGLKDWGLATEMLDAVAQNKPAALLCHDMFLYGTLMTGELADWRMGACLGTARPWTLPGQLWHLGRYPGMRLPESDDDWVCGERISMTDDECGALIEALDAYEDFEGYGVAGSEYLRCLMESGDGSGDLLWCYRLRSEESEGKRIASGDWRQGQNL